MTPEEIVGLIGNIANRQDIREVQERQVKEIKTLVEEAYKHCSELASRFSESYYQSGDSTTGIACSNISHYIEQRLKEIRK